MLFGFPAISDCQAAYCICESFFFFIYIGVLVVLLLIMVFIKIHLFVRDNSLNSKRFITRTELTNCCEPLQKLKVRYGSCKPGLSSQ